MSSSSSTRYVAGRPAVLAIAKLLFVALAQIPFAQALPLHLTSLFTADEPSPKPPSDPSLWLYLGVAAALVILGGAFAGLTIALMGQDEIYLQVIKTSGEGAERKHAAKVLGLLGRGKHWVLVTLLLSNVITNETLPIVLDRSLGGGWPAVLGSTVLIVIFGEVVPQSICVRYGLPIGAWMAPFVLGLMYIMAPVAWPTAKLLDYLLGEDHGTTYKKAGLKTLVTLHKSLGAAGEQLNSDEVTIISAVLDLKEKPVGSIMTPISDVFTLSSDDILDEKTMEMILAEGYSRIPIYSPQHHQDFVGMLLVKMLITYDPEDCKPVRDFALATLPETKPETSCLDIVNFFQEGKSHMVLISDQPGEAYGALGVCTLEDVIEELIGEEIIDESDVFIDVHKAIRRMAPAPRTRVPKGSVLVPNTDDSNGQEGQLIDIAEHRPLTPEALTRSKTADSSHFKRHSVTENGSPRATTFLMRRKSSTAGSDKDIAPMHKRATGSEMREHLKHLGPSNLASRPRQTRWNTVKIKQSGVGSSNILSVNGAKSPLRRVSDAPSGVQMPNASGQGGIGESLLESAGQPAKDGVQALHQGYGIISPSASSSKDKTRPLSATSKGIQVNVDGPASTIEEEPSSYFPPLDRDESRQPRSLHRTSSPNRASSHSGSRSTIRSLRNNGDKIQGYTSRGPARSGSITENIIEANGIRKVVLEANSTSGSSSSSNDEDGDNSGANRTRSGSVKNKGGSGSSKDSGGAKLRGGGSEHQSLEVPEASAGQAGGKKKRRRRKKHGSKSRGGEDAPLLEREES